VELLSEQPSPSWRLFTAGLVSDTGRLLLGTAPEVSA